MRSDMVQVITERGRSGRAGAVLLTRRNRRRFNDSRSFDEAPSHGPMSDISSWYTKAEGWSLRPLKRFIAANVGRCWDDVYSELRASLHGKASYLVLRYLHWVVERKAVLNKDGVACYAFSWRSRDELCPINASSFYVHPETGVLSRGSVNVKPRRKEPRIRDYEARSASQSTFEAVGIIRGDVYIKDAGIWYAADMRPLPEDIGWGRPVRRTRQERRYGPIKGVLVVETPYLDAGPLDVLLGRKVGYVQASRFVAGDLTKYILNDVQRYYGRLDRYCAGKGHQLDTRTLRRLGLKNEPMS